MKSSIIVKNQAEMVHRYFDAPSAVSFLQSYHRHELHIETEIEVFHDDRELEFIMVKRYIDKFLSAESTELLYVNKSCEMVAKEIIEQLLKKYGDRDIICKVFEDGENGAKVVYERQKQS